MNKYIPVLGWGLAGLIAVYSAYQYHDIQQLQEELLRETRTGDVKAEIFDQEMSELELTIADLRNRLNFARQDLALARENIQELQNAGDEVFNSQEANSLQSERPIARIMNSPRVREIGSRMMLNSRYGRFINNLALNADEREQLNEIMNDVINRQNDLRIQLANGEITREEFQAEMALISMEDALSNFLTPDEMDAYYAYEEEEESRRREQAETAMRMQVVAQTPGLTDENRDALTTILLEELGQSGRGFGQGMMVAGISTRTEEGGSSDIRFQAQGFNAQAEVYDNILDQLEGTMPDDQMAIVENYLEQQQMQMEMIQEIMSMQGEGGEQRGIFISR